jgi:serine/threonine-protein kinase
LGTPYYMSPEQVSGRADLDVRTDVYALGVVLYECITGSKPFVADTMMQLSVLIHEGKYTAPAELRPGIPPDLAAVIQRAMAYKVEDRYSGVRELADALAAVDLSQVGRAVVMGDSSADDALGHTMPLGGQTAGLGAADGAAAEARSLAGTANTVAGAGGVDGATAARALQGGRRGMLLLAGGALAVATIGVVALLSRSSNVKADLPSIEPAPIQSESGSKTITESPIANAPVVTPPAASASATASAESDAPAAPTSKAASGPAAASRTAAPAQPKSPSPARGTAPTRAKEHGLAEENPF